ncbi:MAG: alpha/beta fold hydrolase [Dokdonella sp.]
MKKICIAVLLALSLLYVLYAGAMYRKQTAILFPAASGPAHAFGTALPAGAALIEVPVAFGKARAVYWPPRDRTKPASAIWYAHGNYETVQNSFDLVQPLVEQGFAVMQFEYPGYGGADGTPEFDAIGEAADATWDWLARQPEVDPQRMIAMGYSIGGGPAAEVTRRRNVAALVLLSTFTSITDIAWQYALPPFLVRFPYNNIARVGEFKGPIFIEHGRRDEVIPFALGQALAAAAPHAEFFAQDCGHTDCHLDQSVFAQRLPAWLDAHPATHSDAGASPPLHD